MYFHSIRFQIWRQAKLQAKLDELKLARKLSTETENEGRENFEFKGTYRKPSSSSLTPTHGNTSLSKQNERSRNESVGSRKDSDSDQERVQMDGDGTSTTKMISKDIARYNISFDKNQTFHLF